MPTRLYFTKNAKRSKPFEVRENVAEVRQRLDIQAQTPKDPVLLTDQGFERVPFYDKDVKELEEIADVT